jgi:hypothetical protein
MDGLSPRIGSTPLHGNHWGDRVLKSAEEARDHRNMGLKPILRRAAYEGKGIVDEITIATR